MTHDINDIAIHTYGPLTVLRSAAGYYVGTLYREPLGLVPGSRDSDYFPSFQQAQSYLNYITADEAPEEDSVSFDSIDDSVSPSEIWEQITNAAWQRSVDAINAS